jgi:hypothetical protein
MKKTICSKCDRNSDMAFPIQPKGKKNRKWLCNLCLSEMPRWEARILMFIGQRRMPKLFLINTYYNMQRMFRKER